jgi:glucokinase
LGAAARAGEKSARAVIDRAGEWLGVAAAHVVTTLHPQLIVLGGGVSALDELLINPMRRVISARVQMFPSEGVQILRSKLGERAGIYGALAAAARGGVTLEP